MRVARMALVAVASVASAIAMAAPAQAQTIPPTGVGSAKVVPLQVTGPAESRFNLVMGDGYTEAELPKFRAAGRQAPERALEHRAVQVVPQLPQRLRGRDPFAGVAASTATRTSTSPEATPRCSMGFWGGCNPDSVQRLLTVRRQPPPVADLVAGTDRGNRQILAIGNSDTYGGAGGTLRHGVRRQRALRPDHPARDRPLARRPAGRVRLLRARRAAASRTRAASRLGPPHAADRASRCWPSSASGGAGSASRASPAALIGRYEGGLYADQGVWRPSQHSMMKTLGYYFDQVCREIG